MSGAMQKYSARLITGEKNQHLDISMYFQEIQLTKFRKTCAEDDDKEKQRACHRVTNIKCTRWANSTVSRCRWLLSGSKAEASSVEFERERGMVQIQMDERVVSYRKREGLCDGSTTSWEGRAARGCDHGSSGFVTSIGGMVDIPCRRQCYISHHDHVHYVLAMM